ncbi:MAG: hypothetical protein PHR96_05110 [Clostridia bacterium]|nr:hypothetical protein [Clostridia bacterium]
MSTSGCPTNKEHWGKIKNISKIIVDYLFDNAPNLWKLLYYISPEDMPLVKSNLTNSQKANMIISNAKEMYTTNSSVSKSIIFQDEIDEAFANAVPQIRIFTGNKWNINDNQGVCMVHFKIVIPNKQLTFVDEINPNADRSDFIVYELCNALEQKVIPELTTNTPLFNNRNAPNGAGRSTGASKGSYNTNFSGQLLTFAVLI